MAKYYGTFLLYNFLYNDFLVIFSNRHYDSRALCLDRILNWNLVCEEFNEKFEAISGNKSTALGIEIVRQIGPIFRAQGGS